MLEGEEGFFPRSQTLFGNVNAYRNSVSLVSQYVMMRYFYEISLGFPSQGAILWGLCPIYVMGFEAHELHASGKIPEAVIQRLQIVVKEWPPRMLPGRPLL